MFNERWVLPLGMKVKLKDPNKKMVVSCNVNFRIPMIWQKTAN